MGFRGPITLLAAALALLAAIFIVFGRYHAEFSSAGEIDTVFVVDRFTGSVKVCNTRDCRVLPDVPSAPPATGTTTAK